MDIIMKEHGPLVIAAFVVILLIVILGVILATNGPAFQAIMNTINSVLSKAGIATVG